MVNARIFVFFQLGKLVSSDVHHRVEVERRPQRDWKLCAKKQRRTEVKACREYNVDAVETWKRQQRAKPLDLDPMRS
jgi:hypothetical protein